MKKFFSIILAFICVFTFTVSASADFREFYESSELPEYVPVYLPDAVSDEKILQTTPQVRGIMCGVCGVGELKAHLVADDYSYKYTEVKCTHYPYGTDLYETFHKRYRYICDHCGEEGYNEILPSSYDLLKFYKCGGYNP